MAAKTDLPLYKKILSPLVIRLGFLKLKKRIKELPPNLSPEDIDNFLFSKQGELITPWQFREEFLPLLKLYKDKKPKYILEIGTANGGTLFAHCRLASDNAVIISIDLPQGKFGGGYPHWKTDVYKTFAKSKQQLHLLRVDSHAASTIEKVKQILNGNKFDYLFIDGDHSYEGVKKDFEIYSKLSQENATVVFHDVAHHPGSLCKVDVFWNEIKNKYTHKEFIKEGSSCFGIGVLDYLSKN